MTSSEFRGFSSGFQTLVSLQRLLVTKMSMLDERDWKIPSNFEERGLPYHSSILNSLRQNELLRPFLDRQLL